MTLNAKCNYLKYSDSSLSPRQFPTEFVLIGLSSLYTSKIAILIAYSITSLLLLCSMGCQVLTILLCLALHMDIYFSASTGILVHAPITSWWETVIDTKP